MIVMAFPIALIVVGVVLVLGGRLIRVGGEPRCKACLFDLTGNTSEICPECGRSIDAEASIISGNRRHGWIRSGIVMAIVGGIMFAAVVGLRSTKDSSKPVWMLDAELRLLGPSSEKRIYGELNRRLGIGMWNTSQVAAIGDVVTRRAMEPPSHPLLYEMLEMLDASGNIPAGVARSILHRQLLAWPNLNDTDRTAIQPTLTHLLERHGATWEEMLPIIELTRAETDATVSSIDITRYRYVPDAHSWGLLDSWWRSGKVELSDTQIRTLIGNNITAAFVARPKVNQGTRWLPTKITGSVKTALHGSPFSLPIHFRVVSIRIDGQTINDEPYSGGSTIYYMDTAVVGISDGPNVLLEDIGLGSHTVEVDYEVAIMPDGSTHNDSPWPERFNETPRETVTPLVDKVLTLSSTFEVVSSSFEVVPGGGDEIALLEPGSPGVPTVEQVRRWIRVMPLYVTPEGSSTWPSKLQMNIKLGPPNDAEEMNLALPINFAWHAIATQGDLWWELGTLKWEAKQQHATSTQIATRSNHYRRTKDGKTVPYDAQPDPDQPIHIVLTPDPDVARGTVNFTEIWNGTIDLGFFPPTTNPSGSGGMSYSDDDFVPLPPLGE